MRALARRDRARLTRACPNCEREPPVDAARSIRARASPHQPRLPCATSTRLFPNNLIGQGRENRQTGDKNAKCTRTEPAAGPPHALRSTRASHEHFHRSYLTDLRQIFMTAEILVQMFTVDIT